MSIAKTYFTLMRARDIEALVALFSPDARFILPDGREFIGHGEIRSLYLGLFAAAPPTPTPQVIITQGHIEAAEIEARMEDGTARRTANFFHLNPAGKIETLSIYRRESV